MYHQYQPLVYYCGKRVIPALGVGLPTRSTVVIPALGVGLPTRSTVFSEENTLKRYRYSVWVNQPGVLYSSQEVFPSRTGQGLKSEADSSTTTSRSTTSSSTCTGTGALWTLHVQLYGTGR